MKTTPLKILLHLNPWNDNPISIPQVQDRIGGGASVYSLSDQGIEPSRLRRDAIPWRQWSNAIDAMLLAAERDAEREPERDRHYYVCGRAPLPLYAYVGIRLSKWASRGRRDQPSW